MQPPSIQDESRVWQGSSKEFLWQGHALFDSAYHWIKLQELEIFIRSTMVFFRKLYLIASVVFIGYFSWQRCFATAAEWNRWQRRCHRLTKLQQRITFPELKSIGVKGVAHSLPLKAVGPPERNPTQEELEYLVGFFDGDGCDHEQ